MGFQCSLAVYMKKQVLGVRIIFFSLFVVKGSCHDFYTRKQKNPPIFYRGILYIGRLIVSQSIMMLRF